MRCIILISSHRFEAIFCYRFGATFSKDTEEYWHFTSENTPEFYSPTLKKETLVPCNKWHEGLCPKMLIYALDELFHVFMGVKAIDLDVQHIAACDILLFPSLCCTEWRGRPINSCKPSGDASTMVDVNDKMGLE